MPERKFYEMSRQERIGYLKALSGLTDIEHSLEPISFDAADKMVENAVGIMSIPMGIATNFVINGKEVLIPMAIEEPSVIAAASKAAKIAKVMGGFTAEASKSLMIGQVQVVGIRGAKAAAQRVMKNKKKLLMIANEKSRSVVAVDLQVRQIRDTSWNRMGAMLLVELILQKRAHM